MELVGKMSDDPTNIVAGYPRQVDVHPSLFKRLEANAPT